MKIPAAITWFRGLATLLLLFGYFLNVVSFESFHQAIHHHDHSHLHTAEAEADPCHRAIFHGDLAATCQHSEHITEFVTECDLCDVVVNRDHLSGPKSVRSVFLSTPLLAGDIHTKGSLESHFRDFDLRGPPVV